MVVCLDFVWFLYHKATQYFVKLDSLKMKRQESGVKSNTYMSCY